MDDRPPKAGKLRWDEGRWKKEVGGQKSEVGKTIPYLGILPYVPCAMLSAFKPGNWKLEPLSPEL